MATGPQLDPQSLVARIIAELQANPEAQQLLLRALLTNEFLGMPARLDAIEKDIAELKIDVAQLKEDVAELKTDVAYLRGSDLENRFFRQISGKLYQRLRLRRGRVMLSPIQGLMIEFGDLLADAEDDGIISEEQYNRILNTDFVIRAHDRDNGTAVWVVVEASYTVGETDVTRARASADYLKLVVHEDVMPVVAGQSIDPRDLARAEAAGVRYVEVR